MDHSRKQDIYTRSKELLDQDVIYSEDYVKELGRILRHHEWRYYIQNDPILSDFEYDMLYKKLEAVEQKHPEWIQADSPSQRVSSDLTTDFKSVEHTVPMLSLDNSYNADDLNKFDQTVRKLCKLGEKERIEYVVEPKLDGGSIALIYEQDIMTRAATRGNGVKGEEITPNARQMSTIPLNAPFSQLGIVKAEVRGEAVIDKVRFVEINKEREEAGKTIFANPRNTAAGGLRTKNPKETRDRGTEALIFQLAYAVNENGEDMIPQLKGHFETIEKLHRIGFKVDRGVTKKCHGIEEVIDQIELWAERRESYPYEIDGMVIKVNDYTLQELCGYTSHHPKWAIAYKFKAKQATTTLEHVEYQIGKVGSITPVAKVSPTPLAGVTVSSISLHNEEFITTKDLRIGDKIIIERAGDVIPYIVKSLPDLRDGTESIIRFPSQCPSCETSLEKADGEAAWRCPNYHCAERSRQRLFHHVSKDAMDIDGLGPSIVERFWDLGWIRSIDDIYNLDYSKIAELEGFGEKSMVKLKTSIEKAKHNPIQRILHGLSIHHLGKKVSRLVAERINHILDLQSWTLEDFTAIPEVGPVVGTNVVEFFNEQTNVDMLKRMEEYGVDLNQKEEDKPKEIDKEAALFGKSILFTGTLPTLGRKEAQELASSAGARNISAVSSKLDILVVGEKAGSKLKKAEAIGTIQILTEEEFLALIQ